MLRKKTIMRTIDGITFPEIFISQESLKNWILANGSQGKTLIDLDIELKKSSKTN